MQYLRNLIFLRNARVIECVKLIRIIHIHKCVILSNIETRLFYILLVHFIW